MLLEEPGTPARPAPSSSQRRGRLSVPDAGTNEQRARWLPRRAVRRGARHVRSHGRSGPLFWTLPRAEVVVLSTAKARWSRLRRRSTSRRSRRSTQRASYGRRVQGGGERLPADAAQVATGCRAAIAAELTGIAAADPGDGGRVRRKERKQFDRPIGAYQAVCAPLRGDAARRRRSPARSTYYAAWTADAEPESLAIAAAMAAPGPGTRAGRSPPPRSRSSAASASPGSMISSSGSSVVGSPGACSAPQRPPRAGRRSLRPRRGRAGRGLARPAPHGRYWLCDVAGERRGRA